MWLLCALLVACIYVLVSCIRLYARQYSEHQGCTTPSLPLPPSVGRIAAGSGAVCIRPSRPRPALTASADDSPETPLVLPWAVWIRPAGGDKERQQEVHTQMRARSAALVPALVCRLAQSCLFRLPALQVAFCWPHLGPASVSSWPGPVAPSWRATGFHPL